MRHRPTLSAETAGWALAGIGIPGTMPIRSFRETDSCIAHSVGASIHRGGRIDLRSFPSDTFTMTLTTTFTVAAFITAALISVMAFITVAALETAVMAFITVAALETAVVAFIMVEALVETAVVAFIMVEALVETAVVV